jgi:2-C-methyl-D-erythritol 4-phosphate cytidylyltransferase/2-C-methyl-D-erythritol 2,4-cyclodiphosphate synthase
MGSGIPKQFMSLRGKTVLARSVEAFVQNEFVDELYLVINKDYEAMCRTEYQMCRIIVGGAERQDSVFAALKMIPEDVDLVLVHDGARPFVTGEIIDKAIEKAAEYGAAVTAVPVKDTVKTAENGIFEQTLDRSRLYSIQTPQGFKRKLLLEAYQRAFSENFYGTDDAVLVEKMGEKVYLVEGDYHNIKITTKEDITVGEAILDARSGQVKISENTSPAESGGELRIGTGFDVHRLVEGRKLILGGVEIPFAKGLLGHSDADVLLHAVMDALLGAAALGDIGRHFPDTDQRYLGASSLLLLKQVGGLLSEKDYTIVNIDATLIAQRPKIAPYIAEMTACMASALGIEENKINIKGTTTEKLGFCGREEGICAQASVLIKRRNNL